MSVNLQPFIHTVFEPKTSTWQYIVADPTTNSVAIIDSVLDFDPSNNTITTSSADNLLSIVDQYHYNIVYILETHAHADHLTAARYIQNKLRREGKNVPQICIGKRITQVQHTFATKYGIDEAEYNGVFDKLLEDDEILPLGDLEIKAIHLPGHTPDHLGYIVGPNVFTGDSIFLPDVGSARCDFPGGDAAALFNSMSKLLALPPHYRLYSGHDYPPSGEGSREPKPWATVAEHKANNKHVRDGTKEEDFVQWRSQRDSGLGEPKLLHHALQFNIRAGQLPRKSEHGHRFLHVPLKVPESAWSC